MKLRLVLLLALAALFLRAELAEAQRGPARGVRAKAPAAKQAKPARARPADHRPGIIATVGPRSGDVPTLRAMIRGGMDVARLNLAHNDARSTPRAVQAIRRAARSERRRVPILLDLPGGKVRLGVMKEPVTLRAGQTFDLKPGAREPTTRMSASVRYRDLARQVKKGDRVLLDDGRIELEITRVGDGVVRTRVIRGGALRSNLGLALAGRDLPFPRLSARDRRKLAIAIENGADWIGVSMVQSGENLLAVRRALERLGAEHVKVVAKIESHSALANLDEIIDHADIVMIARGDLASVVGPRGLPAAQRRIADRARARGKPFIVASNLLSGMQDGPGPTRGNRVDVARARSQKAQWLMLNETATGRDPARTVQTLDRLLD